MALPTNNHAEGTSRAAETAFETDFLHALRDARASVPPKYHEEFAKRASSELLQIVQICEAQPLRDSTASEGEDWGWSQIKPYVPSRQLSAEEFRGPEELRKLDAAAMRLQTRWRKWHLEPQPLPPQPPPETNQALSECAVEAGRCVRLTLTPCHCLLVTEVGPAADLFSLWLCAGVTSWVSTAQRPRAARTVRTPLRRRLRRCRPSRHYNSRRHRRHRRRSRSRRRARRRGEILKFYFLYRILELF